jgi:hypothetical protein
MAMSKFLKSLGGKFCRGNPSADVDIRHRLPPRVSVLSVPPFPHLGKEAAAGGTQREANQGFDGGAQAQVSVLRPSSSLTLLSLRLDLLPASCQRALPVTPTHPLAPTSPM